MGTNVFMILILVVGLLLTFLGLAPILSRRYFDEAYSKIWKSKKEFMSKENTYIYSRYIRQIFPLLMGPTLIVYAIYHLLEP